MVDRVFGTDRNTDYRNDNPDFVDQVLAEVEHERRACIVVRIEHVEHEQVHGEADQAQRETGECSGRLQRVGRGDIPVLERNADDRPSQYEQPEPGRQRDDGDEADTE